VKREISFFMGYEVETEKEKRFAFPLWRNLFCLAVIGHTTVSALTKEDVMNSMSRVGDSHVCDDRLNAKQTTASHPWYMLQALSLL
jgi:hypothetical protein